MIPIAAKATCQENPEALLLLNLCNFVNTTRQHTNMWLLLLTQQAKYRSAKVMLTALDTRGCKATGPHCRGES